jgi:hypothetical protein
MGRKRPPQVTALSYHFLLSNVLVVFSTQLHLNFAFLSQPSNTSIFLLKACYVSLRYLMWLGEQVVKGNYTLFPPSGINVRYLPAGRRAWDSLGLGSASGGRIDRFSLLFGKQVNQKHEGSGRRCAYAELSCPS